MGYESEPKREVKKKRKLSKKQKLMGTGALVATTAAVFATGVVGGGGKSASGDKLAGASPIELAQEHGQERFLQSWDTREQNRVFSEGCDASTPEESANILLERAAHDARALAAIAGAIDLDNRPYGADGFPEEEILSVEQANDSGFINSLMTPDKKKLSSAGIGVYNVLKERLTGKGSELSFVDASDSDQIGDSLRMYTTGVDDNGAFVRDSVLGAYPDNTKLLRVLNYPAEYSTDHTVQKAYFEVSGCQPLISEDSADASNVPEGPTEAQGHDPIQPSEDLGSETGGY